ncbi:NETI motif-containing protein [Psychrobacillus sp. FSL H8-0484]|uniref:NETI motif-containing protein n=1 Tax=unclassified Psychrobacillus TaxID=2636677 RepID=UPI0030FD1779
MKKETVWFEVQEDESISTCMDRMIEQGFQVVGRKEEPIFAEVDGQPVPVKQLIQLKGVRDKKM